MDWILGDSGKNSSLLLEKLSKELEGFFNLIERQSINSVDPIIPVLTDPVLTEVGLQGMDLKMAYLFHFISICALTLELSF